MSSNKNAKNCASGKRLKEERERIGLSQDEFALNLDTTRRTVGNWEGGNSAPDVFDLIVMGFGLRMDTNYIVTGERTPFFLAQSAAPYSPSERASVEIRTMKLTEEDAEIVTALAKRLSIK